METAHPSARRNPRKKVHERNSEEKIYPGNFRREQGTPHAEAAAQIAPCHIGTWLPSVQAKHKDQGDHTTIHFAALPKNPRLRAARMRGNSRLAQGRQQFGESPGATLGPDDKSNWQSLRASEP